MFPPAYHSERKLFHFVTPITLTAERLMEGVSFTLPCFKQFHARTQGGFCQSMSDIGIYQQLRENKPDV
jgi:hypothetical protein